MSEDPIAKYMVAGKAMQAKLFTFYEEITNTSIAIVENPALTAQIITAGVDRWNHIRSEVFLFSWKISQALEEARDEYSDGMRNSRAQGSSGKFASMHYEERAARYEQQNLAAWKLVRILEKLDGELKPFLQQLDKRVRWLEDKRRQIHRADDDYKYASSKDFR